MNRRNFLSLSLLAGVAASIPAPVVKHILDPLASRIVGGDWSVDFSAMTLAYIGEAKAFELDDLLEFVQDLPGGPTLGKFKLLPKDVWAMSRGWKIRFDAVEKITQGGWRETGEVAGNIDSLGEIHAGDDIYYQEGQL